MKKKINIFLLCVPAVPSHPSVCAEQPGPISPEQFKIFLYAFHVLLYFTKCDFLVCDFKLVKMENTQRKNKKNIKNKIISKESKRNEESYEHIEIEKIKNNKKKLTYIDRHREYYTRRKKAL